MTLKRIVTTLAITAGIFGMSASAATAAKKDCPPGQTAVITVVGTELVTTCRVL